MLRKENSEIYGMPNTMLSKSWENPTGFSTSAKPHKNRSLESIKHPTQCSENHRETTKIKGKSVETQFSGTNPTKDCSFLLLQTDFSLGFRYNVQHSTPMTSTCEVETKYGETENIFRRTRRKTLSQPLKIFLVS